MIQRIMMEISGTFTHANKMTPPLGMSECITPSQQKSTHHLAPSLVQMTCVSCLEVRLPPGTGYRRLVGWPVDVPRRAGQSGEALRIATPNGANSCGCPTSQTGLLVKPLSIRDYAHIAVQSKATSTIKLPRNTHPRCCSWNQFHCLIPRPPYPERPATVLPSVDVRSMPC